MATQMMATKGPGQIGTTANE
jgi:hypothetical protein